MRKRERERTRDTRDALVKHQWLVLLRLQAAEEAEEAVVLPVITQDAAARCQYWIAISRRSVDARVHGPPAPAAPPRRNGPQNQNRSFRDVMRNQLAHVTQHIPFQHHVPHHPPVGGAQLRLRLLLLVLYMHMYQ